MKFSKQILFLFFISVWLTSYAQSKYEVRGVWFSTVWGLDFPSKPASSASSIERQKKELAAKLDSLHKININTIFFQVRNRGDLSYESTIEPWHYVFGGKTGVSPGYDVIQFAIDEAHKRGMEFHAWFVCMPLGSVKQVRDKKQLSLPAKHPDLCIKYKDEWYMNPANPNTSVYLAKLIAEATRKYDFDGVHLDYIRYPDRTDKYPDDQFFKKSKAKDLSQWRRDNITRIVCTIHDSVKSIKPYVKISAAVIGRYCELSHNRPGWRGFEDVFQDAMQWINMGKMDFITPMTYYQDPLFGTIVSDWCKRLNPDQIIPGVYTSMISPKERNWSADDLFDQIMIARLCGAGGVAHFRAQPLIFNEKKLSTMLASEHYRRPGAIFPQRNQSKCGSVTVVPHVSEFKSENNIFSIKWESAGNGLRYNIYGSDSPDIDINEGAYLICTNIDSKELMLSSVSYPKLRYIIVTSVDRYGNESDPSSIASLGMNSNDALAPLFDK